MARKRPSITTIALWTGALFALTLGLAPRPANRSIDPDRFTARTLARTALIDLRSIREANDDDYRLTRILLDWAQEYEPDNEQIVRRRLDAAWGYGDEELSLALTRRIVELNPGDTVALLRLIASSIGQLNTVEERIATYDRLLGPRGESIPPDVRSRLALDAALLHRERGESAAFADRLKLAVSLDSTHKEAAALAATYFSSLVDDPIGRFDLLINLLMADPLDPNIHATIARELAAAGALDDAARFHDLATGLLTRAGAQIPDAVAEEAMVMSWRRRGTTAFINSLNSHLAALRRTAVDQAARAGQQIDPASVTLPASHERARALAAHVAGDSVTLDSALFNLGTLQKLGAARLGDAKNDQARRGLLSFELFVIVTKIWLNVDAGAALAKAEELLPQIPEDMQQLDVVQTLPAFIALAKGEPERAINLLDEITDTFVLADAARVVALDRLGRSDEAAETLRKLAATNTLSIPSAWASQTLIKRGLRPPEQPHAATIAARARQIPSWVDRMTRDPSAFQVVELVAADTSLNALEPAELILRIRNTSPIPLSVGPDRVINTTFLLGPRILAGPQTLHDFAGPDIVDASQRLRLDSRTTMEVRFDPGMSATGLVLDASVTRATRVRWRVTQGPVLTAQSPPSFRPGPLCVGAETDFITRPILPEAQISVADVARRIATGAEDSLPVVLGAARAILPSTLTDVELPPETVEAIASACAERFPSLSTRGKLLMLAMMPSAWQVSAFAAFDAVAARETDPRPAALYLVTRVRTPVDPALDAAETSSDPDLAFFARTIRSRMQDNRGGLGTRRLYFAPSGASR